MLPLLFCLAALAAPDVPAPKVALPAASPVIMPARAAAQPAAAVPGALTSIVIQNTGPASQAGAPLTFGQVFAPGHLMSGQALHARLSDGSELPLQVDVKARHADGSVRHAVLSLIAPPLAPGQARTIGLVNAKPAPPAAAAPGPAALLKNGFSAAVTLKLGQQVYRASADALLRSGSYSTWLAGPIANEWLLTAPLTDARGVPHPHLTARFAIRALGPALARVDVTIENGWAFEAAPSNFTYDAEISVGGVPAYSASALTHFHHARWRKLLWWGKAPQIHIRHDSAYLIASRALPNYDPQVVIGEAALHALQTAWQGPHSAPMGPGLAAPYMPTTGGRPDIGLLPSWAVSYLLSMDPRAKEATLGTADQAGSWSVHYRDRGTGRPVSLFDFPYMTLLGQAGDTVNPATKQSEAFPACASDSACRTPYHADAAHQPGFAYLPYLVTGDVYDLEELQFWAMWNTFVSNPGYRQFKQGLVKADEVRGQAWSLRTLGEAAYITPDADPLKAQFQFFLDANLAWYDANYLHAPDANRLGVLTNGYALAYNHGTGLAPWMDDFFTSALGHVAELGFGAARPLLQWKAQFPIARMNGDGACWITGAIYALKVRDSASSPFYTSIGQAWKASHTLEFAALPCAGAEMAKSLHLRVGEMSGYAGSEQGYPSNLQPALAYAADSGAAGGARAWTRFSQRTVKPDYGLGAQFAIVPRH